MLPEKGSASEGLAVFCGDVFKRVCFARYGLAHNTEQEAKGKALKKRTTVPRKKSKSLESENPVSIPFPRVSIPLVLSGVCLLENDKDRWSLFSGYSNSRTLFNQMSLQHSTARSKCGKKRFFNKLWAEKALAWRVFLHHLPTKQNLARRGITFP
ncbi:hypothetical protein VNO77_04402 [Canavalia gladiata]|uniref:Uncharacterized protein n=1 Tax=Canavalia gladiata TaxID=3824 RepID=A0AAN9MX39_CANGL